MPILTAILVGLVICLSRVLSVPVQTLSQTTTAKPAHADVAMLFRGSMPVIEVTVNGQGPFLFAIDTGGQGMARVDSSLVTRLKLPTVDKMQASDGSGRNTRTLDVVQLESITFGGVQFKDVRAPTRDYNTSPSLPRIDGILGFNLFADYLLTLDYPAKRVRLERGELPKSNGADVLSFESPRGIPVIELIVGSNKVNAHIDSGNTIGGFVLPISLVEKLTVADAPMTVGKARTVSNEIEIKEARLIDSIRLGRFEFATPTIVFPALSDNANIGAKVLREFALTFDQKNKRVRLKRQEITKAIAQGPVNNIGEFEDYPGRYGERTISVEDGALFLQREGGPKHKLVPIAANEFALERIPEARIKFVRSESKVSELHVLNQAGGWDKSINQS